MWLKSIQLTHFKNYFSGSFEFRERIVGISGPNGAGKTNLLDAIYFLCFTKSYFTRTDSAVVTSGCEGFRLQGDFLQQDEPVQLVIVLRETGKKEISWNGEPYSRFSGHIGRLPAVFITPDDISLITGGSEERRKFLDTLIAQVDPVYLQHLISYNKYLQQKNSYLKNTLPAQADHSLLNIYDKALADSGATIHYIRKEFLKEFSDIVKEDYHKVADNLDDIDVRYKSSVDPERYYEHLLQHRANDIVAQRSLYGIHRDDIELLHGDNAFKALASQGQKKTMLFALKLGEFEILHRKKGFSPFLLLDDAFEKLDEKRMENLLRMICDFEDAQIFITDTHENRIRENLEKIGRRVQDIRITRE